MMGFIVSGQVPVPARVPVMAAVSPLHPFGLRPQGTARAGHLGDVPA